MEQAYLGRGNYFGMIVGWF